MGAQYSTGVVSPDWKGWLEERCSLEHLRAIYKDFQTLISTRRDDDGFFLSHRDFLQVKNTHELCRVAQKLSHLIE